MAGILVTISAIMVALIISMAYLDRMNCHARWAEYDPVWGLASGCRIKIDGRYTPTENIRDIGVPK